MDIRNENVKIKYRKKYPLNIIYNNFFLNLIYLNKDILSKIFLMIL